MNKTTTNSSILSDQLRAHIGRDAALSFVAVSSSFSMRGPAHVQVVEDGVRPHLVRSHHQLERVGLRGRGEGSGDEDEGRDAAGRNEGGNPKENSYEGWK